MVILYAPRSVRPPTDIAAIHTSAPKRPGAEATPHRLSSDAGRLVSCAESLSASGSRIEDEYWEDFLARDVERLLDHGADAAIDAALAHLDATLSTGFDALIEIAETRAETAMSEIDSQVWHAVLVGAPILACSRYSVPSGPCNADAALARTTRRRAH